MADDKTSGGSTTNADNNLLASVIRLGIGAIGSVAGATGLLFALGFLIVNISLSSYGVYETGLIRERYMSTGIAFIFILSILVASWVIFIPSGLERFLNFLGVQKDDNSSHDRGIDKFVRLLVIFGSPIIISLVATVLLGYVWKISLNPSEWLELSKWGGWIIEQYYAYSARQIFFWCMLVSVILALWQSITNWDEVKRVLNGGKVEKPQIKENTEKTQVREGNFFKESFRGKGKVPQTREENEDTQVGEQILEFLKDEWSQILLLTILLFLILVVYARNVFPALPAAMGGGLPIVVQFSAKDEPDREEMIKLDIPFEIGDENEPSLDEDNQDDRLLTRRVTLIARTGSSYVLLVFHPEIAEEVVVSLPKDHVDSIIYYPEEYSLNEEYRFQRLIQNGGDALTRGENQTAIKEFKKALDKKADSLQAHIGLGDAYVAEYIAEGPACEGTVCIDEAVKSYKKALCPTGNFQDCNAEAPAIDNSLIAEALYKLSRAYALRVNSQEKPELAFLGFRCPGIKVNYENIVDYTRAVTATLECAIEVDEKSGNPQNYAKEAKNDHIFHLEKILKLRTDDKFISLLFPSESEMLKKEVEVVRRLNMEARDLQESGDYEKAVDRYTWAITLINEPQYNLFTLLKEEPRLYHNRAGLYLELHGKENRHCEDGDCLNEAIADYDEAVKLEPNNAAYLMDLAGAQREDSRLEEAVNTYKKITDLTKIEEDLSEYALAWLGIGEIYLYQGINIGAKVAFNETIGWQPGNAAAFYGRAVAEARIGEDLVQAIRDLRKAIELEEAYLQKAEDEPAFAALIDPNNLVTARQKFEAGQVDERGGNLEDAIQKYREAIQLDPLNDAFHAALAEAYRELDPPNWNEAEIAYQKAIDLYPKNDIYYLRLGEVYAAQGKYEQAISSLSTATEQSPENDIYYLRLGEVYAAQGKYEQARDAFNKSIDNQPENAAAYFGRSVAEARIGEDLDQAIRDLLQAIALEETYLQKAEDEPVFAPLIDLNDLILAKQKFEAGQIDEREGNLEDAKQKYLEAIELDRLNDAYHATLAEVYHKLKVWNEAEITYNEAINLSPENDNYHFNLGEMYAMQGKYEQAIESFDTAIEINGERAIYYDRLSAALFKYGLVDEAFNAGEDAVKLEFENPDYRFHLAEIYRQIESWHRAITNYERIITRNREYGDAYCGLVIVRYQIDEGGESEEAYQNCQDKSDNDYLKDQAELARTAYELRQSGTGEGG